MKKSLLLILTLLCIVCFSVALTACGETDDGDKGQPVKQTVVVEGITYSFDNDTDSYITTSAQLEKSNVTIPEKVEGKPVSAIGDETFRANKTLKKITLPDSVKEIGYAAFRSCTNLEQINLEKVEVIGGDAFREAFNSVNIELKMSSVRKIGSSAFASCPKLRVADMTGATLNAITESCFDTCALLYTVKLPETVKTIWKRAFAGNSCLVNINLENVEYFKANCFEGCKNLTSLTLTNAKDIRNEAFITCSKLSTIIIGNNLERVYQRAFFETALGYFEIGNGDEMAWGYYSLGGTSGATKDGTLRNYFPLWALGDEAAQALFDPANPTHWATIMTLNYNTGYFICTAEWVAERGYENGQKFAWDFFMNEA